MMPFPTRSALVFAASSLAASRMPAPQHSALTGTYRLTRGKDAGCIFEIAAVAADSVRLQLSCNRGAPSYNMGDLDERLARRGSEVVFQTTEFGGRCVLRFRFVRGGATVTQEGDDAACGFGYGVVANGTYQRVSRRRPAFDLVPTG
jgi:hypothetical protein